jgi:D-inositol-3-phosphate glycosyltransferase
MKIAMVSEHASPLAALGGADAGGQNVHVEALARALARRGHDVTVHTRRDDPLLPTTVPICDGVLVRHVDAGPAGVIPKDDLLPYMGTFAARLHEEWVVDRPDVVHAHFWMSALAALDAARALDIPVTVTFHALGSVKRRHQGTADTSPPTRIASESLIAGECARVVATATEEVDELLRLGVDARSVVVVPCGVDLGHFRPDGPRMDEVWAADGAGDGVATADRAGDGVATTLGAGDGVGTAPGAGDGVGTAAGASRPPRILSLGRMVPRKGVDDVVRALAGLPGAQLVVAGGPAREDLDADPEYRRLRDLAADLGVGDRVSFLGRVARAYAPALIRSADVLVCAPWYEPFGIVPLEAMACGRPLVGTAVGGLLDTVVDGVTGLLVPPKDPPALAHALGGLLADDARRASMGGAALQRARTRYSWESVAAATERIYAEVVAENGAVLLQEAG